MEEHGMYFGKKEFYQIIRDNGGVWNDAKERPIICLMKSLEHEGLYWAIPVGNYEHRDENAKLRIEKYMNYDKKDIRSCFYHIGNTNEKSIFFISDAVPFTEKYIDREYKNKTKKMNYQTQAAAPEYQVPPKFIMENPHSSPQFLRNCAGDIPTFFLKAR